jgi:hypothetical protein
MIIPAFFIFRPYGTLKIVENGVAINIWSIAGHFSGFLPTIYYEQSKTIFKTFQKMVDLHYCSSKPGPNSAHEKNSGVPCALSLSL